MNFYTVWCINYEQDNIMNTSHFFIGLCLKSCVKTKAPEIITLTSAPVYAPDIHLSLSYTCHAPGLSIHNDPTIACAATTTVAIISTTQVPPSPLPLQQKPRTSNSYDQQYNLTNGYVPLCYHHHHCHYLQQLPP